MSTTARLTLDQYDRMIAAGIFDEDQRLEFIQGEVREMTPIGPLHEDVVDFLTRWGIKSAPEGKIRVRIQNSVGIPALDSAPEPDIVLVNERSYAAGRPMPDDILLVIEVAESSLEYDRGEKAELYAQAGIKDYWVVNPPERCVEVFRDPQQGRYGSRGTYRPGEEIRPLTLPDAALPVARVFQPAQ